MADMRGTDDEIKIKGIHITLMLFCQMGLQPELYTEKYTDLVLIFLAQPDEIVQIGICI